MGEIINIYCDESCHLEKDGLQVMVLGAVWCPLQKTREISVRLREIKEEHGLSRDFEIKWGKVSPCNLALYRDILNYFFDDDDLHFRVLIVPDKHFLEHKRFGQDHDTFYYKMYFDMLKVLFSPKCEYRIYLDIKDTRSAEKTKKLHEVLCNANYDFNRRIISRVQTVRSHEVEQIQLADLLIGAVQYANRGLESSPAKVRLIERMRKRSGYTLTSTTLFGEDKVNIFKWRAT